MERLPFSDKYQIILSKMPHYQKLSAADQIQIQHSIIHFIYTKEFLGIDLEVTDEIKVVIAFYACLLLVHKGTANCYDNLQTIVVYAHTIVSKQVKSYGGIYTKEQFMIAGQSSNDTVIITWHEAKREAYHMRHNNVIIYLNSRITIIKDDILASIFLLHQIFSYCYIWYSRIKIEKLQFTPIVSR